MRVLSGGFNINWLEIDIVLGFEDGYMTNISIYPNPTTNILQISSLGFDRYSLLSISGQIVKSDSNDGESRIDVSMVPPGIYFLKLFGVKGSAPTTHRVVIRR